MGLSGDSRQVIKSAGPAEYELVGLTKKELQRRPEVDCRYCGTPIIRIDGKWYALRGRWPNLNHCHKSARVANLSVPHEPEEN